MDLDDPVAGDLIRSHDEHRHLSQVLTSRPPAIGSAKAQALACHVICEVTDRRLRRVPTLAETVVSRLAPHTVQVIAAPAALEFFDQAAIEKLTGNPVCSHYNKPGSPRSQIRSQIPDAIIVAPATYNTVNKWAQGTSDTYALGILAEMTGMDTPIVVLPFVNSALANRAAFRRSVDTLRGEGVHILLGPGGFEPHPPRTGGNQIETFPWNLALDEAERLIGRPATHQQGSQQRHQ